jgi:arylformamidase
MDWFDISAPVFDGMPGFPGDPDVRVVPAKRIAAGDPYNLSRLALGSHSGTHVDPPNHFVERAPGIDEVDLRRLNGPCCVVDIPRDCPSVDARSAARVPPNTERVLFRTANSARWAVAERFFEDYVAVDPAAADVLLARGVRLVGIDALSVERDPTDRFPVHRALLGAGALILEGVRLEHVPAGAYELRCLPLRLRGGDGGPCRAALVAP